MKKLLPIFFGTILYEYIIHSGYVDFKDAPFLFSCLICAVCDLAFMYLFGSK